MPSKFIQQTSELWQELRANFRRFPWRNTALTLRERLREDRLAQTASSLTFSTVIALVPLFTVGLAIFSALPVFTKLEGSLQQWLVNSLVPDHIARTVLKYLQLFSTKASRLGWGGGVVLLLSALTVVLTVDRALNAIWRVRRKRSLIQRVLMYWTALTLGPLILGLSVTATTYLVSSSKGLVTYVPTFVSWLWNFVEFGIMATVLATLYRVVPYTPVRLAHALTGGLLAALTLELVKRLLAWYLAAVPSYSLIYGAFATVPILLIWIYLVWLVVLLGAVITAYLPSLLAGVARRGGHEGWDFQLTLEILSALNAQHRLLHGRGLSSEHLAHQLGVTELQLERPLDVLVELGWIGRLDEEQARWVLTTDLSLAPAGPLVEQLLMPRNAQSQAVWQHAQWASASLTQLLPPPPAPR